MRIDHGMTSLHLADRLALELRQAMAYLSFLIMDVEVNECRYSVS